MLREIVVKRQEREERETRKGGKAHLLVWQRENGYTQPICCRDVILRPSNILGFDIKYGHLFTVEFNPSFLELFKNGGGRELEDGLSDGKGRRGAVFEKSTSQEKLTMSGWRWATGEFEEEFVGQAFFEVSLQRDSLWGRGYASAAPCHPGRVKRVRRRTASSSSFISVFKRSRTRFKGDARPLLGDFVTIER
jgi:hypothetical protein